MITPSDDTYRLIAAYHLPKWDLVAADGIGNGLKFNEDGTRRQETVQHGLRAINRFTLESPGETT